MALSILGADLLASQGFRIVMPDILKGNYATGDMYGPGEESVPQHDILHLSRRS
jgi:hypothetical protein